MTICFIAQPTVAFEWLPLWLPISRSHCMGCYHIEAVKANMLIHVKCLIQIHRSCQSILRTYDIVKIHIVPNYSDSVEAYFVRLLTLDVPRFAHIKLGCHAFVVCAPSFLYHLPPTFQSKDNIESFKRGLRMHFLIDHRSLASHLLISLCCCVIILDTVLFA